MKSKKISTPSLERYGLIEALESRIAPAAVVAAAPTGLLSKVKPSQFITASAGGSIKLRAGDLLTTGASGGGIYLLYVEQGQVVVHTTDLNNNQQLDFNEITGLSVGNGTRIDSFVDIHGDIVTDLNPDFTLTDSDNNAANGRDGRVLLDANIAAINMRSITASDFIVPAGQTADATVSAHLAMSSYSIFGNIYAGGGLGLPNDPTSGLHIDTSGAGAQGTKYAFSDGDVYAATQPVIGSVFVGTAASGQPFSFGTTGQASDISGTFMPFTPAPGETGASIYNVTSTTATSANTPFTVGEFHAGNGGFNAGGGSLVNFALQGSNGGGYALVAGDAGTGTSGHAGGSILNFSEKGTITGQVLLQAGNGGTALTGAGGTGGGITFDPTVTTSINAHVVMKFGSGGNGYTAGGNGTGISSGHFTTPEGALTNATNFVSTTHAMGTVGTTQSFDFNGDGFSDAVFSTKNPNQVQVVFGSNQFGFGFDPTKTIYLSGPSNVSSIAVADFNGDGHPDIAVSSGDASFAGVEIFLSQYDARGLFTGFSPGSSVQLPDLTQVGLQYTAVPITKMVSGDFNGDGHTDLAVVAAEKDFNGVEESTLIYLNGDAHGHFFADFKQTPPNSLQPIAPYEFLGNNDPTKILIKSTALQTFIPGAGHDVIIEALQGDKSATVYDYTLEQSGQGFSPFLSTISFGKVDTDRSAKTAFTAFQVLNFVITEDKSSPNQADFVAVSSAPARFLLTAQGDGAGNFTVTSGDNVDQAGIPLADDKASPAALVAIPDPGKASYSDIAILDYKTDQKLSDTIYGIDFTADAGGLTVGHQTFTDFLDTPNPRNTGVVAFDTYNPHPALDPTLPGSGPFHYGFVAGIPVATPGLDYFAQDFEVIGPGGFFSGIIPFKNAGYAITGGSGGSALDGHGGQGGALGQALQVTKTNGVVTATGTFSILYPADVTYGGVTNLTGGAGGNGFSGGGAGGNVFGASVSYAPGASLLTGLVSAAGGNGGQSLRGTGGGGGTLGQLNIETGGTFIAGNGGGGTVGGDGGSVLGTNIPGLVAITANAVAQFGSVAATGGQGGTGLSKGGTGGR